MKSGINRRDVNLHEEGDVDFKKELLRLQKVDWAFKESDTQYLTHNYHPYPARFIPQIPSKLIQRLSEAGEWVFDPFCGAGTTLVESTLLGRNCIGNDLNPIGALVSKVKSNLVSVEDKPALENLMADIEGYFEQATDTPSLIPNLSVIPEYSLPDIPNRDHWFTPTVQEELGILLARINRVSSQFLADFCRVAISAILVSVSNQAGETYYGKKEKTIPPGTVYKRFVSKLREMWTRMEGYREKRQPVTSQIINNDLRILEDFPPNLKVQLVITSPPYPNAFDYFLYHRHRMFWLGYDPIAMSKKEIGSHLNYQRKGTTEQNIAAFKDAMRLCFQRINNVLETDRFCCFVIGDSIFKKQLVENDQLIIEVARGCGFKLEVNLERDIHAYRRSFSSTARRAKSEHIVILRKVEDV